MRNRRRSLLLLACAVAILVPLSKSALTPMQRPAQPVAGRPSAAIRVATLPTATPSVLFVLKADEMATVVSRRGLPVWPRPSATKAADPSTALPSGAVVFLTQGPRRVGEVDWWQVQAEVSSGRSASFGWVQATDVIGDATLAPIASACPEVGQRVEPEVIKALGTLRALACFEGQEITMRGRVTCQSVTADYAVGGPSWFDSYAACLINDALALNGPTVVALLGAERPPTAVTGNYEVTGHFDDPEAATCSWIPIGTSVSSPVGPPDPGAVIVCRQAFVVSKLTKVT